MVRSKASGPGAPVRMPGWTIEPSAGMASAISSAMMGFQLRRAGMTTMTGRSNFASESRNRAGSWAGRHDRAPVAVPHQDVVGDPDRDLLLIDRG